MPSSTAPDGWMPPVPSASVRSANRIALLELTIRPPAMATTMVLPFRIGQRYQRALQRATRLTEPENVADVEFMDSAAHALAAIIVQRAITVLRTGGLVAQTQVRDVPSAAPEKVTGGIHRSVAAAGHPRPADHPGPGWPG